MPLRGQSFVIADFFKFHSTIKLLFHSFLIVCSHFQGCSKQSDAGEQDKIRSHSSHNHREVTSTLVSSGGSERAAALQRSRSTRVVTNNTNPLWYRIRQWTIITVQVQLPVPWISQGEFSISSRWLLTTDSWSALVHLVMKLYTLTLNVRVRSCAQAILIPYTGSLDHMSSEPSSVTFNHQLQRRIHR